MDLFILFYSNLHITQGEQILLRVLSSLIKPEAAEDMPAAVS